MQVGDPVSPSGWVVLDQHGRGGEISQDRLRHHCTWCAIRVKPPRVSWCSDACVKSYELTQPGHLRRLVYQRDEAICSLCGVDCDLLRARVSAGLPVEPEPSWSSWWWDHIDKQGDKSLWQMDHVVPLHLGGEPFNLNNLTTLCVVCHSSKTRQEATNRKKL